MNKKELNAKGGSTKCLGAAITKQGVNFAASMQAEADCRLLIYEKGIALVIEEFEMPKPLAGNVRSIFIENLNPGKYEYNFLIDGIVTQDPYCRNIVRDKGYGEQVKAEEGNSIRCGFISESFDWKQDTPLHLPAEDVIMYSIHPRGFTRQKSSGVKHKGTFLGIQEKIPYLCELGINQLEIMPSYDFDEVMREEAADPKKCPPSIMDSRINYWGFKTGFYFSPKSTYACSENTPREFKTLVKALHEKGIELIMEFYFNEDVTIRMILDCLTFWVNEYHVDGFHLIGSEKLFTETAKDPYLGSTKLYATYIPPEEVYKADYIPKLKVLAEYNDGFMIDVRRLLRGEEDQLGNFLYRMRRNPQKSALINYMAYHNSFTLMDAVSYDNRHNEANLESNRDGNPYNYSWNCGAEGPTRSQKIIRLRKKQIKNAFCFLLLSQGTPMILGGDEIGNSQQGNNNPYCQDNEIGWLDWSALRRNKDILDFVKGLIRFRKAHKIMHWKEQLRGTDYKSCGFPDISYHSEKVWYGIYENTSCHIGIMYCGAYAEVENFIYVAYNMHADKKIFALPNISPNMKWYLTGDTSGDIEGGFYESGSETELKNQRVLAVEGRTTAILIGR